MRYAYGGGGGGGGGGASALVDLTDVNIAAPARGELMVYDPTSARWMNGYVSPTTRGLRYYGDISTPAGFTDAWNAAAADIDNWWELIIPDDEGTPFTYTQEGAGLTMTLRSGRSIHSASGSKEACRIYREDTDERAGLVFVCDTSGETIKGCQIYGITSGHVTQQPGAGSGYASAFCFTQTSDSNVKGFAQNRFFNLGAYQSQQMFGLRHPNGVQMVPIYESDIFDCKGKSLSRSFVDFITDNSIGSTNMRMDGLYLDNNGVSFGLTDAALRLSAWKGRIGMLNLEGNAASATEPGRLFYIIGDSHVVGDHWRAESWGVGAAQWDGYLAFLGWGRLKLEKFEFQHSNADLTKSIDLGGAGAKLDILNISNQGSFRVDFIRLRHKLTQGIVRLFNGYGEGGPPIEPGVLDAESADAYTYLAPDAPTGFSSRFPSSVWTYDGAAWGTITP